MLKDRCWIEIILTLIHFHKPTWTINCIASRKIYIYIYILYRYMYLYIYTCIKHLISSPGTVHYCTQPKGVRRPTSAFLSSCSPHSQGQRLFTHTKSQLSSTYTMSAGSICMCSSARCFALHVNVSEAAACGGLLVLITPPAGQKWEVVSRSASRIK